MMPEGDETVISCSKVSSFVNPFTLTKFPGARRFIVWSAYMVGAKIFTMIESVKSVSVNFRMDFSFRMSLLSFAMILPRIVTSPISPMMSEIGIASSSNSRPQMTSGRFERIKLRIALFSAAPFFACFPAPFKGARSADA